MLVLHKIIFCKNEAVYLCVTMQKRAGHLWLRYSVYLFHIAFADKKLGFCAGVFKGIYHENEALPIATSCYGNVPLYVIFHMTYS